MVQAELIAERTALVPGQVAKLALRLRHAPHWHTYWLNPGDSGLPTRIQWRLPDGFAASEIDWPPPQRFELDGLFNLGYEGEVLLPLELTVPDTLAGQTVRLEALAKWLACRDICIPEQANVHIELAVAASNTPDPRWQVMFAKTRASLPRPLPGPAQAELVGDGLPIRVRATDLPAPDQLDGFIEQRKIADHRAPTITRRGEELILRFAKSEYFEAPNGALGLVLTTAARDRAWRIDVPLTVVATP